jgi:hypothetical protein
VRSYGSRYGHTGPPTTKGCLKVMKNTNTVVGEIFSVATERKVISVQRIKLMLILMVTAVVTSLSLTSLASADSVGQCNMRPGNEMHSVGQWLGSLESEGVLGQAAQENFVGFNSVDGKTPRQWASERAVLVKTTTSYTGMDYSCQNGHLVPWKVTTNPAGTSTFMKLPPQYNKHNSSRHRTKEFSRRLEVPFQPVLGFASCANTHGGKARYILYVRPKPKHQMPAPQHREVEKSCSCSSPPPPPPAKPEEPKGTCSGISGSEYLACVCSNIGSSSASVECKCVGINVTCEEKHEKEEVCPPGTEGKPPHCEEPKCPPGTIGKPPRCEKEHEEVCPPGTEGKPPHCEKEEEPKHWTSISCTGFEEISGGGSFLVDCAVSDDNGAPISLKANSNDSNSRVSGINCFSNGGTPTCPNGGTFEFRVSGINDGSSVIYSSITATATANGVSETFKSDPFPVDPSAGGFARKLVRR